MLTVLIFLILFATILLEHFYRLRKYDWLKKFEGPSNTLPVFGDALQFLGHCSTVATKYHSNFQKYGKTWKFWLMTEPTLMTSDARLVQQLLGSHDHLQRHEMYDYSAKMLFGNFGLVTSSAYIEDESFTSEEQLTRLERALDCGLKLLNVRIMKPWTRNPFIWKVSGNEKRLQQTRHTNETFTKKAIRYFTTKSSQQFATENNAHQNNLQAGKSTQISLGSLLADKNKSFEWKADHFVTLAAAGTGTTAIAATMTLFFLALNPECQVRAEEEIDLFFEKPDSLKLSELGKLKYLRMCIKEAMRLHAPVPLIGRTTSVDILLEDGRKIPKGTGIMVVLHEMNLNPEYFPDPLRFNPERFDEENLKSIKPGSFIPFSIGPRNCIGQKYAECVLLPVMALILKKFNVHTQQKAEDIKFLFEVAGTPFPEVQITFEERENKRS